jgi:hypothetical protein
MDSRTNLCIDRAVRRTWSVNNRLGFGIMGAVEKPIEKQPRTVYNELVAATPGKLKESKRRYSNGMRTRTTRTSKSMA